MKVNDFMTTDVIWANKNNSICDIAKLMNDNHIGSVPICDDNNAVLGLITDRDIVLRTIACDKEAKNTSVEDVMTGDIVTIEPSTNVCDATKIMEENQIRRIPVVENNKLVGILSIGDLIRSPKTNSSEIENTMQCICEPKNNY